MADSDFKKMIDGASFSDNKSMNIKVVFDTLIEEVNLVIHKENTSVTLSVFVSKTGLRFRLKDYVNINVEDTDEHPGRHTCIMRNGGLEGVQFYRNPTNDEVATEDWINYSFETIWESEEASTQFWIGDIWVGIKNKKGYEVFMALED